MLRFSCFASFFIRGSKHLETIKALRLRRRAFIFFSVFGDPDEELALVFDLLLLQHSFFLNSRKKILKFFIWPARIRTGSAGPEYKFWCSYLYWYCSTSLAAVFFPQMLHSKRCFLRSRLWFNRVCKELK